MKRALLFSFLLPSIFTAITIVAFAQQQDPGYVLEQEKTIGIEQPGPHKGGGLTTSYPFFSKDTDLKVAFRKRVLRPGSAIGYHLQKENEIYYIVQGKGEMSMNGKVFEVNAGDAILTKPGSSHGLKPTGNDSLVVIINYILP